VKSKFLLLPGLLLAGLLFGARDSAAQAVAVTVQLETNRIAAGDTTILHVYAQVVPALRSSSERIFSWYVDVVNTNGNVAGGNYVALTKPTSDNDPLISSTGTTQDAHRRGIYDTFLNRPGAGVAAPVELLRIPVLGVSAGTTRFQVQAGTGVTGLSTDFLVAPTAAVDPFTGGDYSAAQVTLQVTGGSGCNPSLALTRGAGADLTITFIPCPGRTHTVEFRNALADATGWQALPGAPHNSGSVTVVNQTTQRFFRLRVTP
jgi:hypothetical protein